jgi:hypothetical protein
VFTLSAAVLVLENTGMNEVIFDYERNATSFVSRLPMTDSRKHLRKHQKAIVGRQEIESFALAIKGLCRMV